MPASQLLSLGLCLLYKLVSCLDFTVVLFNLVLVRWRLLSSRVSMFRQLLSF